MCVPKFDKPEIEPLDNILPPLPFDEIDSDAETVILNEIDFTWEESFYYNQIKFEIGFLAASDQAILDLYSFHFPNVVYSVLRKGCDWDVYKRAINLEDHFDAVGISIDPDCYLHIYGLYYMPKEPSSNIQFFCLKCVRADFSEDRNDLDVFSLHNYMSGFDVECEITSMLTNYKYWCYGCNRFLFHIDYNIDYSHLDCLSCLAVVPHDPKYIKDTSDTETRGQLPNNPQTIPLIDLSWPVPI